LPYLIIFWRFPQYITTENLSDYAFVNQDTLQYPLKGICVDFHGYTDSSTFTESPALARRLGEQNIAWVFPYYSVWGWSGTNSMEYWEQVLDAAFQKLGADENTPFVVSGGSMGGLNALNYLLYGKRPAVGCAANCPVTDLYGIFQDSPELRRSILSEHIDKPGDLEEILRQHSPVRVADMLPRIPYFFVFGERDAEITENHLPPLKEKMEELDLPHKILMVPDMFHCDLDNHPKAFDAYADAIIGFIRDSAE